MFSKDGKSIDDYCDCMIDMDGMVCFEFQIPKENLIEISTDGTGAIFIIRNGSPGGSYLNFDAIKLFAKVLKE
jgi:hypothetical protein